MIARAPGGSERGGGGGGGFARGPGFGPPPQKIRDFRGTVLRLVGRLRPERVSIAIAFALTAVGVSLTILGPKILANATNLVFDGVVGRSLPPGVTKAQVVLGLRARGQNQLADMLSGMHVTPGVGVDFNAVGRVLALAALVYLLGALLAWVQAYIMAGVSQRTVYRMRADVAAKLDRLPLSYFDHHERGDVPGLMGRIAALVSQPA